jgi:Pyrimidine reductase, riboflavin biosynthesis
MLPRVIVHNSVSLDGSLTGFDVNLPLHYQIAAGFCADLILVGSHTARTGIDIFLQEIPQETEKDRRKPVREGPLWVIIDTHGRLNGLLHIFRQMEYCRDVCILVSRTTPPEFLRYLQEREYDHIMDR